MSTPTYLKFSILFDEHVGLREEYHLQADLNAFLHRLVSEGRTAVTNEGTDQPTTPPESAYTELLVMHETLQAQVNHLKEQNARLTEQAKFCVIPLPEALRTGEG